MPFTPPSPRTTALSLILDAAVTSPPLPAPPSAAQRQVSSDSNHFIISPSAHPCKIPTLPPTNSRPLALLVVPTPSADVINFTDKLCEIPSPEAAPVVSRPFPTATDPT